MKISVIMIDGSFRENTFGAEYFTKQNFSSDEYEVLWVEFYKSANEKLYQNNQLKIISLGHSSDTVYHSSNCFNEGIRQAKGELLIIPDADVIVQPDFLQKAWNIHQEYDKLVAYGYRYNEVNEHPLKNLEIKELKQKCVVTNPINYGGCITVHKKWLLAINGYDEHPTFETGFHANGLDIYTRFRNYGMAIQWSPLLKLYHPKHAFTATKSPEYQRQRNLINWRSKNLEYLPLKGLDSNLNTKSILHKRQSAKPPTPKIKQYQNTQSIRPKKQSFLKKIKQKLAFIFE